MKKFLQITLILLLMSCVTDTKKHVDSPSTETEEFVLGVWSYGMEENDINVMDSSTLITEDWYALTKRDGKYFFSYFNDELSNGIDFEVSITKSATGTRAVKKSDLTIPLSFYPKLQQDHYWIINSDRDLEIWDSSNLINTLENQRMHNAQ